MVHAQWNGIGESVKTTLDDLFLVEVSTCDTITQRAVFKRARHYDVRPCGYYTPNALDAAAGRWTAIRGKLAATVGCIQSIATTLIMPRRFPLVLICKYMFVGKLCSHAVEHLAATEGRLRAAAGPA
jgi:hypothetical protein